MPVKQLLETVETLAADEKPLEPFRSAPCSVSSCASRVSGT